MTRWNDPCDVCGGARESVLHHLSCSASSPAPVPYRAEIERPRPPWRKYRPPWANGPDPRARILAITPAGYRALAGCVGGWPDACARYVPRSRFAWCSPCDLRHPRRAKQTAGA